MILPTKRLQTNGDTNCASTANRRTSPVPVRLITSRETGHTLLATLVALLLLAAAAALVFSIVTSEQRQLLRSRQQLNLRAMNDAVVAETLARLNDDRDYPGVIDREMSPGHVRSQIDEVSRTRSKITARATIGAHSLTTELIITNSLGGPRILSWRRVPLHEQNEEL